MESESDRSIAIIHMVKYSLSDCPYKIPQIEKQITRM